MRLNMVTAMALAAASLAGCGGGSGSSVRSNGSPSSSSSSSSVQVIASPAANVASLVVDCGPSSLCSSTPAVDEAYVTVTVCAPGTSQCQTIDHVQVDTGSYGLRLFASQLTSIGLVPETAGSGTLAECTVFADGFSWGSVDLADVEIAGETASSVPIQVVADPSAGSTAPANCMSQTTGSAEQTPADYEANGILGVGVFVADCGSTCNVSGGADVYYSCSGGTCVGTATPPSEQVSNPVPFFQSDDNGVIVELPPVPADGAPSATGALVFGIDTESNNGLGGATVIPADSSSGNVTTVYKGQSLAASIIDAGSNGYYFTDGSITQCTGTLTGFYCPASTLTLSATIEGASGNPSGVSSLVSFDIADAQNLNGSYYAFDDLGGPLVGGLSNAFDWGLPFFFGRNVFVAINGMNTSGGYGPFYAF